MRARLRPRRRPPTLLLVALWLGLAVGCAAVTNTPAQDRAWERWDACAPRFATLVLIGISPDGGLSFYYVGGMDLPAVRACFREVAERQSQRAGVPRPPEPEMVVWPRGGA